MSVEKTIGADARLGGLAVFSGGDQATRIALDRIELDHIAGAIQGFAYQADTLVIDKLETRTGRGQTVAEAAQLNGVQLTTTDGNLVVTVPRLVFPDGLQLTSEAEFFAPRVCLEDGYIEINNLSRSSRTHASDTEASAASESAPASDQTANGGDEAAIEAPHNGDDDIDDDDDDNGDDNGDDDFDWHFLNALEGHLNVDLVVDLTLPWIGRRRATHYFRIPIHEGTIDFAKLEDDVHWLEGSFLTLDVVDDKLVLARDLPLVPYSGKALLEWPLEPADVPLAKYQRVHLRNLFRWQVPPSPNDKAKGKSRLTLHEIAMEKINIKLNAIAPTSIELHDGAIIRIGDDEQNGLVDLSAFGELRYRRAVPADPTDIRGRANLLDVTIKELKIGSAMVSMDRLHIDGIETIELGFDGFRPYRLKAALKRVEASNMRIYLP